MKTSKFIIGLLLITGGIYYFSQKSNNEGKETLISITPNHFILGLDSSGTTKGDGWPWPAKYFFEQQLQFLEQNGGGVIEVYNFSNPIPQPLKISIRPLIKVPDVYSGEAEVKRVESLNKTIATQNEIAKKRFWENLEEKILNFQPAKGKDYTYALRNCLAIQKSLSLPHYAKNTQFTLLYSDFINDTPNENSKSVPKNILEQIAGLSQLGICNPISKVNYEDIGAISLPHYSDFIGLFDTNSLTAKF